MYTIKLHIKSAMRTAGLYITWRYHIYIHRLLMWAEANNYI